MEMLLWKFSTHLASETSSVQTVLMRGRHTEFANIRCKERSINDPGCDIICENFLPLIWHHWSSTSSSFIEVDQEMSQTRIFCVTCFLLHYKGPPTKDSTLPMLAMNTLSTMATSVTQVTWDRLHDKGEWWMMHGNCKQWKENLFPVIFLFSFSPIHSFLKIWPVDRFISDSICKAIRVVLKTAGH